VWNSSLKLCVTGHPPVVFSLFLLDLHCSSDDGTMRPLLLVTASVDRMVLKRPIRIDMDLQIAGAVIWVRRSSMEIQLEVSPQKVLYEAELPNDDSMLLSFLELMTLLCWLIGREHTFSPAATKQLQESRCSWSQRMVSH